MRKSAGFTLVEVLVAMAILIGGLIVIYGVGSGNYMRIRKSRLYNNVTYLLQQKITELKVKYKDKPLREIVDEKGDFGDSFPGYRWEFTTQKFEMPDLAPILIGRQGGANDTLISMIKQTQDFISSSVKEGRVTVFVKTPRRELKYSVTTYFVDYNNTLGLGGTAVGQ